MLFRSEDHLPDLDARRQTERGHAGPGPLDHRRRTVHRLDVRLGEPFGQQARRDTGAAPDVEDVAHLDIEGIGLPDQGVDPGAGEPGEDLALPLGPLGRLRRVEVGVVVVVVLVLLGHADTVRHPFAGSITSC